MTPPIAPAQITSPVAASGAAGVGAAASQASGPLAGFEALLAAFFGAPGVTPAAGLAAPATPGKGAFKADAKGDGKGESQALADGAPADATAPDVSAEALNLAALLAMPIQAPQTQATPTPTQAVPTQAPQAQPPGGAPAVTIPTLPPALATPATSSAAPSAALQAATPKSATLPTPPAADSSPDPLAKAFAALDAAEPASAKAPIAAKPQEASTGAAQVAAPPAGARLARPPPVAAAAPAAAPPPPSVETATAAASPSLMAAAAAVEPKPEPVRGRATPAPRTDGQRKTAAANGQDPLASATQAVPGQHADDTLTPALAKDGSAGIAIDAAAKGSTPAVETRIAAPDPQGQAPAPAVAGQAATHAAQAAAVPVRGSPETVAHLAAQIVKKLDGRSTRFDVELDPAGLGRVDVRVEIGASGRMTAAMSFDTPQAAAELRGRANELQRALEQAGFDTSGGLSFDVAGDRGQGRGAAEQQQQQQQSAGDGWRGRAFQAALSTAGDATDAAVLGALNFQNRRASGVDIRI